MQIPGVEEWLADLYAEACVLPEELPKCGILFRHLLRRFVVSYQRLEGCQSGRQVFHILGKRLFGRQNF